MGDDRPSWVGRADPLVLGVVHLLPLPGSPRYGGEGLTPIIDAARRDADRLVEAGFDGYVIENFGDAPFFKDTVPGHTATVMTRLASLLGREDKVIGVNVLRNDAAAALAVAVAAELDFIRVNVHVGAALTDQGVVEGQAAQTLRLRALLGSDVRIAADVDVKHARPLAPGYDRAEAARETLGRGGADVLIVSGTATGMPVRRGDLEEIAAAVPEAPVWIGSGATPENVADLLEQASGVIVGTSIKEAGHVHSPVDLERARRFVEAARNASRRP